MNQERCFDLRRVRRAGLRAIEGNRCTEIRHPHGERVDDSSAIAKSHGTDFPGAIGTRLEILGGGQQIFGALLRVQLRKELGSLFVIARIAGRAA